MGSKLLQFLFFLPNLLLGSGTLIGEQLLPSSRKEILHRRELESVRGATQLDVITPITTVPVINPTIPVVTTPADPLATPTTPVTTPSTSTPVSLGQSWCIARQTASQAALQVALDYACGYGGSDCSAIQEVGKCYNPNTLREHASYAFNDYYQKNPSVTSCNFGGTAIITNIDPSSGTCQYSSTSTSSSVLNTTNPMGATIFGSEPRTSSNAAFLSLNLPLLFTLHALYML